jgi:poly(A) polymerase
MIRKLFGKVFSKTRSRGHRPVTVSAADHGIDRERISRCAMKTCETLQAAGHDAYVVGGAVRDLILGRKPKDFDVATDARPEQVRALFRRSRIIGRRFRLVHVMCGAETVEVSTFRGGAVVDGDGERIADASGRILRDNVFGSREQDAARRDFTINALFYDPVTQQVLDYHNGVADLKKRRLKMIGDPETRYREDPVRMLRAVRLAASRDLEMDPATRKPIGELAHLLQDVPPSRLFDEMLKLLLSGHAVECVRRLRRNGLHHGLLPLLDVVLENPAGERFVMLALSATDERLGCGKPVAPGFLFAALLWPQVAEAWKKIEATGMKPVPALHEAIDQVTAVQFEKLAIPRRFSADMREIWALQQRFMNRSGRRPSGLLHHLRFRAAYDFLLLRCKSGELEAEVGEWWTRFQQADETQRNAMLMRDAGPAKRRRRSRRRKPAAEAPAAVPSAH